jgi:hypothetical protein
MAMQLLNPYQITIHGGLMNIDGAGWANLNATYNTNNTNNTATTSLNIRLKLINNMIGNRNNI